MKYLKDIYFILILSLIPIIPLLIPGLPITHDGQDHVARIANFYLSLKEGNIVPRWAGNLNWGYGHPILMFLYPFPSYFASLFHLLGLSFIDSVKAVFATSYVLSAVFMFLWLKNFLGRFPALIGAIIYIYAPYRFVDLYVRGAIGEHAAFIFMPAVCLFSLKLFKEKELNFLTVLGLSFSSAGLILSHNAISLMFLPFAGFYLLFLLTVYKNKFRFLYGVLGIIYGFFLSAFFWIPAFAEGKYTLRDIVTGSEALQRFVDYKDFIYGAWSFGGTGSFTTQLGIVHWLFVLSSFFALFIFFKRKEKKLALLLFSSLVILAFSIFIMLPVSKPVWETVTILQKFQFPWRFLSLSVFIISLISSLVAFSIKDEKMKKFLLVIVVILILVLSLDYMKPQGYLSKTDQHYLGIYKGTTDTGESAPIWSVRFMEKEPSTSSEIIEGKGTIENISRSSTKHVYKITSEDRIRIRENTLYFPGWKVYVDGIENSNIEFQDPLHRGLITYRLESGIHEVKVVFEDTKLRMYSEFISISSLLVLVILFLTKKKWAK